MKTIKDVAALANVSVGTVSRVLNSPEKVSKERRESVYHAMEVLNYTPNTMARSLVTKSTKTIGLLLPDINNTFIPLQVESLSNELEQYGYSVILCISSNSMEKEKRLLEMLLEKRVDGIIMLGARRMYVDDNDSLTRLTRQTPTIVMDYTANSNYYCVRCDEALGIQMAVEYVYGLGHRKIAFVNQKGVFASYQYKQMGYEAGLNKVGLPFIPEYSFRVSSYYSGGLEAVQQLLALSERPTAVLAAGDQLALGLYYGLQAAGLRIPDDISVVGFSNSTVSKYLYPALTTVDQFGIQASKEAAKMMHKVLSGEDIQDRTVVLKPKIVERDSCRKI